MKIINAMFSKSLGGIQQAFLDYAEAMAISDCDVVCIVNPQAKIIPALEKLVAKYPQKISFVKITNKGKWDFFAKYNLLKAVKEINANIIIAHGSRPATLLRFAATRTKTPLVAVVHNYWFKDVSKADYLFSITQDIKSKLSESSFSNDKIFIVPNVMHLGAEGAYKAPHATPVVGVMARMIEKKGVDTFIKSLGILQTRSVNFQAIIAGDGELLPAMQKLSDELKLNDKIKFTGWVKDKSQFYNDIDIFCLPSLSEPFGIVLLEAAQNKKPIVSTNIEGPAEILQHDIDAIMIEKSNPEQMADAIEQLIKNPEKAKSLAETAYQNMKQKYNINTVAQTLKSHLENIAISNT